MPKEEQKIPEAPQVSLHVDSVTDLIHKAVEKGIDDKLSSDVSKFPFKDFLAPRKVRVMPIGTKTFINAQVDQLPNGFIQEGAKRSLQLSKEPNSTRFKMIFDTHTRYRTPQYPNEALTELEFFSRVYGADLDPRIPITNDDAVARINLWHGRMSGVQGKSINPIVANLPHNGRTLNLSNINDHLEYKILQTWGHKFIAQSWEERNFRPSFWFALVDENREQEIKSEGMNNKVEAVVQFNKIKENREKLWEVLIVNDPNLTLASSVTMDQLKTTVFQFAENRAKVFLDCINDPNAYEKVIIFKAIRSGHLIRKNENYFTIGNEPLGSMYDVITKMNMGDDNAALFKQMLVDKVRTVNL
jgi:hypothetical protein